MNNNQKLSVILIIIALAIAFLGIWLKGYNDKIAQMQQNETGSCYLPDGTCLHTTSDSIMFVALGIAAVIAAVGLYLFFQKPRTIIKKIQDKREEKNVEAPSTLGDESRSLFDIIAKSNGAILQGELVSKSGMDKVKVSRILDKLEMQGLIERRRHGMSNLVVLRKK